jgi:hypothetical protein
MDTSQPRLEASIRKHLVPTLKADGFTGSGRAFRRVAGSLVHALNVQGWRSGGKFAVNVGVHPLAIPDVLGNVPDPKKITVELCEFRRRLAEKGDDQWWRYKDTEASMDVAVHSAARVYGSVGRSFFTTFGGPSSPLFSVTPADFAAGHYDFKGFGSTKVRIALVLARLRKASQRRDEAKAFAQIGLSCEGGAGGLRDELENLST